MHGTMRDGGAFFIWRNFLAFWRIFKLFGCFVVYFGLKGVNHKIFGIFLSKCSNSSHFTNFTTKNSKQYTVHSTALAIQSSRTVLPAVCCTLLSITVHTSINSSLFSLMVLLHRVNNFVHFFISWSYVSHIFHLKIFFPIITKFSQFVLYCIFSFVIFF